MPVSFHIVQSPEDLCKALAVRTIVFCGEQGIAYAVEHDGQDTAAIHVLGEEDGEPVASGRVRFLEGYAKLERIAVRAPWRGHGVGHMLTDFMVGVAREQGFHTFKLNAQAHLEHFYGKHGFRTSGPHFMEAGIDHCPMICEDKQ